ncbi:MAG: OsmC family protein [Gammaproteobacteria bacterium]|nr:OsmC family protein [Gammaproteobacteria bacterium]
MSDAAEQQEEGRFTFELEQTEGYEFKVLFDRKKLSALTLDEPPPLGEGNGPNASRLLAAAVANCLSASLIHCIYKGDVPAAAIRTRVTCRLVRNEKKRLRIGGLEVRLQLGEDAARANRLARCLDLFEDFCVVTASVRQGVPVTVEVVDHEGNTLKRSD